jgi:hypothetical protein
MVIPWNKGILNPKKERIITMAHVRKTMARWARAE